MKIEILAVGKLRAGWAREGVEEYVARIGRYVPIARREVKAAGGEGLETVAEEGERILRAAAIGSADRLVAIDRRGDALDSEGWARLLGEWGDEGTGRVVLVVGGASGLSAGVLAAASRRLSLGPQTMSHELAQLVLAEQLYRAWTILRREPYHK